MIWGFSKVRRAATLLSFFQSSPPGSSQSAQGKGRRTKRQAAGKFHSLSLVFQKSDFAESSLYHV